jgi:hypothetical protein
MACFLPSIHSYFAHESEKIWYVTRHLCFFHVFVDHVELELLPPEAHENPCIKHAVELEQSFMEGAYNRVLSARQAVPHETYVYFMDLLAKTVRYVLDTSGFPLHLFSLQIEMLL